MGTSRALGLALLLTAGFAGAGCMFDLDEVDRSSDAGNAADSPSPSVAACKADGVLGGNCECASGTCNAQCQVGRCQVTCKRGSTCNLDCTGGGCELFCENFATCTAACPKGGCIFHCGQKATCTTTCTGGNCTTERN